MRHIRTWFVDHRMEANLAVRVALAAVLSLAIAQLLKLPIALWAVLTAVILTQMSIGKSVKATTDYLIGTLGAAIYAGAIGVLIPHNDEFSLLAALAIAVAPATLLAAVSPRFSAAPFSAVLVFLAPTITHAGPIEAAFDRVTEVVVGGIVGVLVSLVVLPARARDLAIEAAANALDLMARSVPDLFAQFTQHLDGESLRRVQDSISAAFIRLEEVATEARHERMPLLSQEPNHGPMLLTLRKLRHDLIIVARAALVPLPEILRLRVGVQLGRAGEAVADYLTACATAMRERREPPPFDTVSSMLNAYAAEMSALRRDGLTRNLPIEAVERVFVLGFALDQLHEHLGELAGCVVDVASPAPRVPLVRTDTDAARSGS